MTMPVKQETDMTTKTTTKPDLRLHVRFEDSPSYGWGSHYCHVRVMPVIVARASHGDQRYDSWDVDSYSIPEAPASVRALKGLRISAQMDDTSGRFYGYRLGYHDLEVDLRTAETILPVLRRLDKRMTALSDRFGYPQDLVQFLAHLADALGLTGQAFIRTLDAGQADYEGHGQRSMDVDSLRSWLNDQTRAWRDKHHITEPDAA
jgi:hypothetical protein